MLRGLTASAVRRRFSKFNRRYFSARLDMPEVAVIPAGTVGRLLGKCTPWACVAELGKGHVLLEIQQLGGAGVDGRMLDVLLLHEMIHIEIGLDHDHRSAPWRAAIKRLSKAGALREVL